MKRITLFVVALLCVVAGWAQETITPPEGAEVVDYRITYREVNPSNESQYQDCDLTTQVAFDGNDVYLTGLGVTAENWIKGSISGSQVVFPANQYVGSYSGTALYLIGYTGNGAEDIVMQYDATTRAMYTTQYLLVIDENNNAWDMYQNLTLTPGTGGYEGIPEDAVVYNYTLTTMEATDLNNPDTSSQQYTYSRLVAFKGDNVWIRGLGYDESLWIQGTISGDKATFAARQSGGSYNGTELYLIGYTGNGAEDIVFSYDETTGAMVCEQYILLIDGSDNTWAMMTSAILTRSGSEMPEDDVVTPPAGINPQSYVSKGTMIYYNADGTIDRMESCQWNIKIAWSGAKDVYVQGLCSAMPEAWVKGTFDDDEVTFAKGQYFGRQAYPFYFAGQIFGELSDFVMTFDSSSRTFSGGSYYMVINSSKSTLAPFEVYAGVTFTPGEAAATPLAPQIGMFRQSFEGFDGNGTVQFYLQPYDEQYHSLPTDKLYYEIIKKNGDVEEPFVFTKNEYPAIPEDNMTMMPYGFTDNWSFLFEDGVHGIELFNVDYPTIGVRAVFTGGGEENRSETVWLDCEDWTEPISNPTAICDVDGTPVSVSYTDAQGRTVGANAKGLVIKTVTRADGTHQSIKTIRK